MVSKEELRKVPRDTNFYSTFADTSIVYLQNNNDNEFLDEFNYIIKAWKFELN